MSDRMGYEDDGMEGQAKRPFAQVMETVVSRLEDEARRRVSERNLVEERWLADIAQYEGYDSHPPRRGSPRTTAAMLSSTSPAPSATPSSPRCSTCCSRPMIGTGASIPRRSRRRKRNSRVCART